MNTSIINSVNVKQSLRIVAEWWFDMKNFSRWASEPLFTPLTSDITTVGRTMMSSAATLSRPVELLLVEDSPSDAGLTQAALRNATVSINVHLVEDGEEAMKFLRHVGGYANVPRPDLVLLDLNMPKKDGREVLADIRGDENLESIPIIVLTTSGAPEDVAQIYKLKANCYVQKPVDLIEFMSAIKALDNFWFIYATLPPTR